MSCCIYDFDIRNLIEDIKAIDNLCTKNSVFVDTSEINIRNYDVDSNHTIYTVDPADACQPFKTLDLMVEGSPRGITFSEDGEKMLLGVTAPGLSNRNKTQLGGGRILIMDAMGTIEKQPFSKGLHEPGAMTFAPQTFGRFGG